jgi:hypothetical protein
MEKYIHPFIEVCENVFRDFIGAELTAERPYFIDKKDAYEWDISAVIGLTGEARGAVVISMKKALALKITDQLTEYEHTKITKDRWVEVLTKSLKEERDTITAMKDNLRVGLFFMDEEDVLFEDILQITFALENLMKTEDSFKEIIEKISNFGSEHEKVGESFVLIELLKKASEKTALSENKMVRFEASDIDPFCNNDSSKLILHKIN